MLLNTDSLSVRYGGAWALRGISINVNDGEIVTIVGANGAGKTTLFLAISAVVSPEAGQISIMGRRTDQMPPEEIARLGVAHVPSENILEVILAHVL